MRRRRRPRNTAQKEVFLRGWGGGCFGEVFRREENRHFCHFQGFPRISKDFQHFQTSKSILEVWQMLEILGNSWKSLEIFGNEKKTMGRVQNSRRFFIRSAQRREANTHPSKQTPFFRYFQLPSATAFFFHRDQSGRSLRGPRTISRAEKEVFRGADSPKI